MKSDIHTKAIQVNYHFPGIFSPLVKRLVRTAPPHSPTSTTLTCDPKARLVPLKVASLQSCPRVTQIIISVSPSLPHCLSALVGVASHWAVSLPPGGTVLSVGCSPFVGIRVGSTYPKLSSPFLPIPPSSKGQRVGVSDVTKELV